jgi:hypothetical protein
VLQVSDILEAIRARVAKRNDGKVPAALAERLIRCECGAVKQAGKRCQECGQ